MSGTTIDAASLSRTADDRLDDRLDDRIVGSLLALAIGDALGYHHEFRTVQPCGPSSR